MADRDALRKKKEYQRADAILDELYSVVVDDAAKEWKVVLGNIEDDAFAMEAQLSRRSAFMRRGNNVEGTRAAAQKEEPWRKNDDTIKLVIEEDPGAELILTIKLVVEEDPGAEEEIDFESLTVVQLKERLKLAGLTVSGRKADLILRLRNAS